MMMFTKRSFVAIAVVASLGVAGASASNLFRLNSAQMSGGGQVESVAHPSYQASMDARGEHMSCFAARQRPTAASLSDRQPMPLRISPVCD
jgi:hypothetical protein